jgi:hypothetical protein
MPTGSRRLGHHLNHTGNVFSYADAGRTTEGRPVPRPSLGWDVTRGSTMAGHPRSRSNAPGHLRGYGRRVVSSHSARRITNWDSPRVSTDFARSGCPTRGGERRCVPALAGAQGARPGLPVLDRRDRHRRIPRGHGQTYGPGRGPVLRLGHPRVRREHRQGELLSDRRNHRRAPARLRDAGRDRPLRGAWDRRDPRQTGRPRQGVAGPGRVFDLFTQLAPDPQGFPWFQE